VTCSIFGGVLAQYSPPVTDISLGAGMIAAVRGISAKAEHDASKTDRTHVADIAAKIPLCELII
jgi:hypothetical protein